MTNRHTARVAQEPEETAYSAAIVRFPLVLSVRAPRKEDEHRPSLALNILLVLLLVLACVVWEAIATRTDATHQAPQSAVTSPRAAADAGAASFG